MAIRDEQTQYSASLNEGPFLIIGLGNIGKEYDLTRHNAGFMAVDHFVHDFQLGEFSEKSDLGADIVESNLGGEKVIVAKPRTYMNKSGMAVVRLQNYFSVNDPRILIVYDDIDIEFGTVRTRLGGSSGGHNGIKSIANVLGEDFARVRIGVKNPHLEHQDTADFVLTRFSTAEQGEMGKILEYSKVQIESFVERRFEETSATL